MVNKVDNNERMLAASEFYSLGFDKIFFISSMSGSGTGELLDAITELIPAEDADASDLAESFQSLRSLASLMWANHLY